MYNNKENDINQQKESPFASSFFYELSYLWEENY